MIHRNTEIVSVPGYVVRLTWEACPEVLVVAFEVFENQAVGTDPPQFLVKGWTHGLQTTEDIDVAEVHILGFLKQDDCFQFSVEGYAHLDEDREMEDWFEMLRAVRRLAQAKMVVS